MALDPDAARILETFNQPGRVPYEAMSPAEARAAYMAGRMATAPEPRFVASVRDIAIETGATRLPIRIYHPAPQDSPLPTLIYLHGGGWVLGNIESHDSLCRHLSTGSGCAVVSVDYRLAPEHKFPAPIEDALAALDWVQRDGAEFGLDAARIGIGGDSAGGAIALTTTLLRRDQEFSVPRFLLLLYPALDLSLSSASCQTLAEGYLLTRKALEWFRGHYLPDDIDTRDWRASPLHAESLANLPPTCILSAEYDPLRDEGEALATRILATGTRVTAWRINGQIHGFLPMGKVMTCSQPILDELARLLASELGR